MTIFKKLISILLACLLVLSLFQGCTDKNNEQLKIEEPTFEATKPVSENNKIINSFELSDPELLEYMKTVIYSDLLGKIDNDKYLVDNIELIYMSNEYIEESLYNSKSNVYFGFTLAELEEQFRGEKFVFTLGDDGKTTAKTFETYDDTYERIMKNVAIGTGVILVRVVISSALVIANPTTAPSVSAIFAFSAKNATEKVIKLVSESVISTISSKLASGIETQSLEEFVKSVALSVSEDYKCEAITGLSYPNSSKLKIELK